MLLVCRLIPVVAALLQLGGTALIVWGLKLKPDPLASTVIDGVDYPFASIDRAHWRAVTVGPWGLLVGLFLQALDAILKAW